MLRPEGDIFYRFCLCAVLTEEVEGSCAARGGVLHAVAEVTEDRVQQQIYGTFFFTVSFFI